MPTRAPCLGVLVLVIGCAGSHSPDGSLDAAIDGARDAAIDCFALGRELRAELDRLVACTSDAECGVELDPRCGCAIDRVARRDADTSTFDALAARFRAACPDARSVVLRRECVCHPVVAPGYACVAGMCVHPIDSPDCTFDGAQFRVGDSFPDTDEVNGCSCQAMPDGPLPACTLL